MKYVGRILVEVLAILAHVFLKPIRGECIKINKNRSLTRVFSSPSDLHIDGISATYILKMI
jgi:hypothetical protein